VFIRLIINCLILCLFSLQFIACSGSSDDSSTESEPQFNTVANLGPGPHMGMITGFDQLTTEPYDQPARVAELTEQAIAAGMNISRFQIDWSELETSAGVYDQTSMNELLESISSVSLPTYITLSSIDTDGLTLPDYLMDGEVLRSDLTVASSEVIEAFESFLNWFVPQLTEASVWGLSIGNEGDVLLEDGEVNSADFVTFFRAGLARVNALAPNISSSVTFTGGAYTSFPDETKAILEDSDHATVNYYCLDIGLQVTRESTWEDYLTDLKGDVGNKLIFFQELGCPVGYGDDGMGAPDRPENGMAGSPSIQVDFVEYMTNAFIADPQFIGATWFQLLDWSPELAASFTAPITMENTTAGALTEEWLATSGLCRWADGTCRLAWDQWLIELSQAQEEREQR